MTGAGRRLAAFALAAALPGAARAARTAEQLNFPLSVREAGMGGVNPGGSDVARAWSNPAALAGVEARGEAALLGGALFGAAETSGGAAGAWRVNPAITAGVVLQTFRSSFDEVDAAGDATGTLSRQIISAGLGAAGRMGAFAGGAMLRMVAADATGEHSGSTGPAVDLGGTARWDGFTLGLALRNMGGQLERVSGDVLPFESRVGCAYRYAPLGVTAGTEVAFEPDRNPRLNLGADWWPSPSFALRGGMTLQGPVEGPQATFGASVGYGGFMLDYAVRGHTLGPTNQIALSYAFGCAPAAGAAAPAAAAERPSPAGGGETLKPRAAGAALLNLAVADLAGENVAAGDSAVIADMLRSELVKTGAFNVIEKSNMDKILAEQAFQQTGCTSEECAVKLGKLLNVQRMIVGSFGKLMDKYFINLRVINVENGKILSAESAKGRAVEDIEQGVHDIAVRLANQAQ